MRRIMFVGNCVAQRLGQMLCFLQTADVCPGLADFRVAHIVTIYNLPASEYDAAASNAAGCDIVFSQPLFRFGACSTENLRPALGRRLHLFAAPNFEAYFPDALDIRPYAEPEKFPPPLEWHSRIFIQCRAAGVPIQEVEQVYCNHPLFLPRQMGAALERTWDTYARRERNVEIGTLDLARKYFASEPLFYTWNHPGRKLMEALLVGILQCLELAQAEIMAAIAFLNSRDEQTGCDYWRRWDFGFNAWPIITRHHSFFSFPDRNWFRVGGKKVDIMSCAIAYNAWYDAHPRIFEQALAALES